MRAKAPACQGRRRSAIRFGVEPTGLPCKTGVSGGILSVAPGNTGALDGCMDTRMHDVAMRDEDFPAGFKMVRIRDAGHFLHQEKPEETNRVLLDWLLVHRDWLLAHRE